MVPHTAAMKPLLTEEQRVLRFHYACDRLEQHADGKWYYRLADDEIHVDEKWFYLDKLTNRVYLSKREIEQGKTPKKKCRHKSHIIKVMFLCAVARPRFDSDGNCTFDGKIGMWPFTKQVAAQRTSVNRPRGTLETKCIKVTKAVYLEWMTEKVLPAIEEKWPRNHAPNVSIRIQQDGPPVHKIHEAPEWIAACNALRHFTIELINQPAQSPDNNICDLGYFNSLQADTWKMKRGRTIDDLIQNVAIAFVAYDPERLNRIWLTHMSVCDEIIKDGGGNDYDLPHLSKSMLEKQGRLPSQLELSEAARAVANIT